MTLSYPHFYMAEDQAEHFEGLNPNADQHRMFLNVEPLTGMTIKLHSRIQVGKKDPPLNLSQLNVPLINNTWSDDSWDGTNVPFLAGLPYIQNFPFVWIDLGADIESVGSQA